ncbi:MAG: hypothetical protein ACLGHJ_07305 [Gammaproteobacteria bacterium]
MGTRHGSKPAEPPGARGQVIDLESRRRRKAGSEGPGRIVRIAPENDGIRTLYGNDRHPDRLVSLDIIGWALHESGTVSALVPWLKDVVSAELLADPLNGHCEGYWDPHAERTLAAAPAHKVAELLSAREFFGTARDDHRVVVQSIPDAAGTHAVMSSDGFHTVHLFEVVAWQLRGDGRVLAMLADRDRVTDTPVLSTDRCLYPAQEDPSFRYFFQHSVANQLKRHDPEALACLAVLAGGGTAVPE